MAGSTFKQAVKEATQCTWEEWIMKLEKSVDPLWSHEQIKNHICRQYEISEEWAEWIATMYGQIMGRTPVGVTKDAGVQIGVRKTLAISKERVWNFLTSQEGLSLWIGEDPSFRLQAGQEFASKEGVSGKMTVLVPFQKLRMQWKRPEWDKPSRLQIILLSTNSGKTTIAIHQEMLEDVYVRELMKNHWEEMIDIIRAKEESHNE
ncbi:SRPBCC domain-containing protein [Paenibacillus sp. J2TS4]|uniref:SRPBCC domain-containing protein n=1 Tax=Paenibacillus sp. J2TS4 TaxID=2807194 RepID=UPI001B2CD10B|nr:SRPBCC domain-containing protein [Paenibacillus sp. J2TS4]GIP36602.1 hypothetical protein J2TS4_58120 [Paenibacillus sp. J2TS4]